MKLNKLFPKKKMDEIFTKFGFARGKATNGFIYVNEFNTFVGIGRHRLKTEYFF